MLGLTMTFSTEILMKFFGSFLSEGSISAMNYALRIMFILVGLFGNAVCVASYPFMAKIAAKANSNRVMLTERGSTFGYRNLVIDFRSLLIMKETGLKVVFDATHSLQLPGGGGAVSTGQPEYIIPMARAAMAVGIDGLFVETHPDPASALSDAGAMLPLDKLNQLLSEVTKIKAATE